MDKEKKKNDIVLLNPSLQIDSSGHNVNKNMLKYFRTLRDSS